MQVMKIINNLLGVLIREGIVRNVSETRDEPPRYALR